MRDAFYLWGFSTTGFIFSKERFYIPQLGTTCLLKQIVCVLPSSRESVEEGGWKQSALAAGGKVIFAEVMRIESASQQEALGYISETCNRSVVVPPTSCCFFKIAQGRKNPVSQRASWSQKAWPLEQKCTGLAPVTARHTPVSGPLPLLYLLVGQGIFEMTMWPAPSFIFNALFRSGLFTKHVHSLVPWSDFFLKRAHHQVNEHLHLLLHRSGLLSHILTVTMPRGQKYGRSLTESWAFPVTSTCQSGSCFTEPIQPQGST